MDAALRRMSRGAAARTLERASDQHATIRHERGATNIATIGRILGIDPGSRITGFGVIDVALGGEHRYVDAGCLNLGGGPLTERLAKIYSGINAVIAEHQPDQVVIEQVFVNRSADSALKLGQARGAAIVAAVGAELPVSEYAARRVKQALTGTGAATKAQVQHMVAVVLKLAEVPATDAADALALAICHAHTEQSSVRLGGLPTAGMESKRQPGRRRQRRWSQVP